MCWISRWARPSICASAILTLVGLGVPALAQAPTPRAAQAPAAPAPARAPAAAAAPEAPSAEPAVNQFPAAMDAVRRGDWVHAAQLCWAYLQRPQAGSDADGEADKSESARFYLAEALERLGYTHAAIDRYAEIVTGRRSPPLVPRALAALERLARAHSYDEEAIAREGVLTLAEFDELPPLLTSFVQYRQTVDDLRRGYDSWAQQHLSRIDPQTPYLPRAVYARATSRLAAGDVDAALSELGKVLAHPAVPADLRARALHQRGRLLYERGQFDASYDDLDKVDVRYESGAEVLLEKAWTRFRAKDYRRALGLLHALGAPSYEGRFAPERYLLRSLIFSKFCHFRAAKRSVEMFRHKYAAELSALREGTLPDDIETLRRAAYERTATTGAGALRKLLDELSAEEQRVGRIADWGAPKDPQGLNLALTGFLQGQRKGVEHERQRLTRQAAERVAAELLDTSEQMNLLEYEVGLGIYRRIGSDARLKLAEGQRHPIIPQVADEVYFHFDGEYWSDELPDMQFFIEDRCVD